MAGILTLRASQISTPKDLPIHAVVLIQIDFRSNQRMALVVAVEIRLTILDRLIAALIHLIQSVLAQQLLQLLHALV